MLYMVTFTINIPQMYPNVSIYIPYMDPMGLITMDPIALSSWCCVETFRPGGPSGYD